jgi:hypothetical protein
MAVEAKARLPVAMLLSRTRKCGMLGKRKGRKQLSMEVKRCVVTEHLDTVK